MIVVPKKKPIHQNLNSYYVDLNKLLEHFQGELDAGGIHVKSPTAEGVIYFDDSDVLNGIFETRGRTFEGRTAVGHIFRSAGQSNFSVAVYRIEPDEIFFWSNIPRAESVYADLSAEFTDLEGLIKKMTAEQLTGYIDISIGGGQEGGMIFFYNGSIIGTTSSWSTSGSSASDQTRALLVEKARKNGGLFNVRRVPLAPVRDASSQTDDRPPPPAPPSELLVDMASDLMMLFERTVRAQKSIKDDFNTLVKRKFVQRADQYDFLDPFAAEFEYTDGRVRYSGASPMEQVMVGVWANIRELAAELGLARKLQDALKPWRERYADQIGRLHL
jgi:hypothetical protein